MTMKKTKMPKLKPLTKKQKIEQAYLRKVINKVQSCHFRSEHDSGASPNAMLILNAFRREANMPWFEVKKHLACWCERCDAYHILDQHTK